MDIVTVLGSGAALCSTVSFVPQAVKVIRTGETDDISIGTYSLTVAAFVLWTIYGICRADWPLIITNAICALLSAFILIMTLAPESFRKTVKQRLG